MKLNEILKGITFEVLSGPQNPDVLSVTHDSRHVDDGTMFIAIKGFTVDGHSFIDKAVKQGANVIAVTDKEALNQNKGLDFQEATCVYFENHWETLALIGKNFYSDPSTKLKMIGVTGTNGKTSITQLLSDMFQSKAQETAVIGTIENRIGRDVIPTQNTTPDGLILNDLLRRAVDQQIPYCLMEVSSHALKCKRVEGIAFDVGVFTNLSEDHLDFHKDFEDYFESKALLFEKLQKGAVINADDEYGEKLIHRFEAALYRGRCLSYGIDNHAELKAEDIQYYGNQTRFKVVSCEGQIEVTIPIPGKIYVYNTLACVGAMMLAGYSFEESCKALQVIQPVRGRLENVPNDKGIHAMIDFAHTPDALENVLKVINEFKTGRLITVFGCGGDRDTKKRPLMAGIAERYSDLVIATSDNPRTEDPEAILDDVFKGFKKVDVIIRESNREKAIEKAIEVANEGDVVLVAGKGHENYQIIGHVKKHFDDREIVEKYLNK